MRIAFIGSAGIPNRYGGFESFLEYCAPTLKRMGIATTVTCDARLYEGSDGPFQGVDRVFIGVPSNGGASVIHDLLAFISVFRHHSHIVVLGVSGGLWFPFFRLSCSLFGKRLVVNIDGVEWRRGKFSPLKRVLLRAFDALAQLFAHGVVYDNDALRPYLLPRSLKKAVMIPYAGDNGLQLSEPPAIQSATALTICRIEPENQIKLLLEGALASRLKRYTLVGNWNASEYGRRLRSQYGNDARLDLRDPIYEPHQLAALRHSHAMYLHGHSVGGTNPSLVEMLFYPVHLMCFDCSFSRATAGSHARFFSDAPQLAGLIDATLDLPPPPAPCPARYTSPVIAQAYLNACLGLTP